MKQRDENQRHDFRKPVASVLRFRYIFNIPMERILVADDEAELLEVMVDILEAAGHEVIGVGDGEAAVKELKKSRFDVAVFDVMMPRLDGYRAARKAHG